MKLWVVPKSSLDENPVGGMRLDFRRFSNPILVSKELLQTVLGESLGSPGYRDLVRESSGNLLEEFEDPSDLLE